MARRDDFDTEEFYPEDYYEDEGYSYDAYSGEEDFNDGYADEDYADDGFGERPALIFSLQPEDEDRSDSNIPGPGVGCITLATLLVCAVVAIFLLRLASGIPIPISPVQADMAADQAYPAASGAATASSADALVASNSEAALAPCQVSNLFPDNVFRWCHLISYYAAQHSLNPDLVAAVVWLESNGDELAYSSSGAVGLMQVMPSDGLAASFTCANGPCFSDRPSMSQLQDPEFNLAYGTRMLAGLLNKSGDMREALRSYGPMNVGYFYSDKVLGLFEKYKANP